jgi:nitrite reductase (NADH) large subunit
MAMRYAIIGAGVAGTTAAQAVRETDPEGEIRVFTQEPYAFYTRIRLPELVAGRVAPERLILKGEAWFRENRIDLHVGERVTEVRKDPLTVVSGKAAYPVDRLLLATGGYAFVPPLPGSDLDGVFTLRTMDDALRIAQRAKGASKAVVIGGGLLGLEAGNGLRLLGLRVAVAEVAQRLLPRQTDPQGAVVLRGAMEKMGFEFHLGAQSKEIQAEGGKARRLLMGDGRTLEGDLFLISAGVRPYLELARQLGLEVGLGVKVDDRMETCVPGVYAAGDAVEHRGVYYGIWPAAEEQGRVAGVNMASGELLYRGTVMSNKLKVAGIELVSAGEIDPEGELESEVVSDPVKGIYRKMVYKDGRLVGCILIGDTSGQMGILRAIEEGRPRE